MKLAYDPSMFRDNTSFHDMIEKTARLGYKYIELSPRQDFIWFYQYPKVNSTMIKQVKHWLSDAGVSLSSVLPVQQWSSPNEQERQSAVRNMRRTIEITSELGVDTLNTEFSGDKYNSVTSEGQWYKSMEELVPDFERNHIKLEIQAHPNDFIETSEEAAKLIRSLDLDWVSQVWCSAHAFYSDKGVGDVRKQILGMKDTLTHVLIADTMNYASNFGLRYIINPPAAPVTIHQHLNPGEGEVDFEAMYRTLNEIGFDGIVTNNVFAWPDKVEWSNEKTLPTIKKGLNID
ncbi:sugar phosphate isomerase/epimerase [Lactobacillus sp. LC28-10]|uniref:Sugar phosphate isomerase/epimerase n=1 Tax=Secundilactobacillus angelensis TaxID=2722706 RepID=A0ABX1L025_9LACO|nr:sugar phosphate isomerase/epimerase [Secundilactobacillus angelensis]MCH5461749.1 sugar phosphate isomerase/epimerase [Secundilactobacillus angelensis]NLR18588.1 sugar phosphate isomerase/epimerase [Secundilactobacillus angelensis]